MGFEERIKSVDEITQMKFSFSFFLEDRAVFFHGVCWGRRRYFQFPSFTIDVYFLHPPPMNFFHTLFSRINKEKIQFFPRLRSQENHSIIAGNRVIRSPKWNWRTSSERRVNRIWKLLHCANRLVCVREHVLHFNPFVRFNLFHKTKFRMEITPQLHPNKYRRI